MLEDVEQVSSLSRRNTMAEDMYYHSESCSGTEIYKLDQQQHLRKMTALLIDVRGISGQNPDTY